MGGRGSGRGLRGARTRGSRRAEARRGARGRGGHHARRETRPSPFPPRKRAARPAPWPAAVRLRWRSHGSPSTHRVGAPHTSHARYVSGDVKIRRGRSIRTPACQRPEQKQPGPSSFPDRCARQLGVTAPRGVSGRGGVSACPSLLRPSGDGSGLGDRSSWIQLFRGRGISFRTRGAFLAGLPCARHRAVCVYVCPVNPCDKPVRQEFPSSMRKPGLRGARNPRLEGGRGGCRTPTCRCPASSGCADMFCNVRALRPVIRFSFPLKSAPWTVSLCP